MRAIPAAKGIALINISTRGTFQSIRGELVMEEVYELPTNL
jgi:hypothetical protein